MGRNIVLDEAFYSQIVWDELQSGRYPQLAQWWAQWRDYQGEATIVEGWDVEQLADEAHRLAAAYRVRSGDAEVQRELDEFEDFLWVANETASTSSSLRRDQSQSPD
jgi:hypothetical protein